MEHYFAKGRAKHLEPCPPVLITLPKLIWLGYETCWPSHSTVASGHLQALRMVSCLWMEKVGATEGLFSSTRWAAAGHICHLCLCPGPGVSVRLRVLSHDLGVPQRNPFPPPAWPVLGERRRAEFTVESVAMAHSPPPQLNYMGGSSAGLFCHTGQHVRSFSTIAFLAVCHRFRCLL